MAQIAKVTKSSELYSLLRGRHGLEERFPPLWIFCIDGFRLSIQKSDTEPWTHVKVSCQDDPILHPWAEFNSSGIYCEVPIEVVELMIKVHNATGKLLKKDETAIIMKDILHDAGCLKSMSSNPNDWTKAERAAFGIALELYLEFEEV